MNDSASCPKCNKKYEDFAFLFPIPCYHGHVLCGACNKQLKPLKGTLKSHGNKKCWLFGEACTQKIHFICPQCEDSRSVFHIPGDTFANLASLQEIGNEDINDARKMVLKNAMEKEFRNLKDACTKSVSLLTTLKEKLNEHTANCRVSKISGSFISLIGGGIFIAGANLTPFTAGATMPLIVVGGIMSGIGSGTAGGTGIVEYFINKNTAEETVQHVQSVQEHCHRLVDYAIQTRILNAAYRKNVVTGGINVLIGIGKGVFQMALKVGKSGTDAIRIFAAGTKVGKSTAIIPFRGLVAVAALIDIVTIVANGREHYRGDPAEFTSKIDETISEIKKIEDMSMDDLINNHLE